MRAGWPVGFPIPVERPGGWVSREAPMSRRIQSGNRRHDLLPSFSPSCLRASTRPVGLPPCLHPKPLSSGGAPLAGRAALVFATAGSWLASGSPAPAGRLLPAGALHPHRLVAGVIPGHGVASPSRDHSPPATALPWHSASSPLNTTRALAPTRLDRAAHHAARSFSVARLAEPCPPFVPSCLCAFVPSSPFSPATVGAGSNLSSVCVAARGSGERTRAHVHRPTHRRSLRSSTLSHARQRH
jgi:hypothetical protein